MGLRLQVKVARKGSKSGFLKELFVPNQWEAAGRYGRVFGFEVIQAHVHWAEEGGSLMISNDAGDTSLNA